MKLCVAHGQVDSHSGSGRYIKDVAVRFAEEGVEVALVCHECDADLLAVPRLRVHRIPRPPTKLGAWRGGFHLHYWWNRRHCLALARRLDYDVVLGSDLMFLDGLCEKLPPPRLVYAPLSMIAPLEIESYELGGMRHRFGVSLYRRLQRDALARCDALVRFTPSAVEALERYYGMPLAAKSHVAVYVSREFESLDAGGASSTVPAFGRPEPRELLWVGRLVRSKNVAFLLRAVARLRGSNWRLRVCSDGPERPALETLARELGIEARVDFLGPVQDLASVYRSASALLTASVLEQYSLTLMEAYAFGVPCIGLRPDWRTVFNSNPDQIDDGVTGYLVSDEVDMAGRIDELLADEPRRLRFARSAWQKKQAGYTFEAFFGQLRRATCASHPRAWQT